MDVLSYSEFRAELDDVMNRVVEDRAPVIVTRKQKEAVVLVSLADWHAIEETSHLLSHPTNAKRLADAIRQLDGRPSA